MRTNVAASPSSSTSTSTSALVSTPVTRGEWKVISSAAEVPKRDTTPSKSLNRCENDSVESMTLADNDAAFESVNTTQSDEDIASACDKLEEMVTSHQHILFV